MSQTTGESQPVGGTPQAPTGIGVTEIPTGLSYAGTGHAPGTTAYYEALYRKAVVNNVLSFQKKMNSGRIAFGRQMDSQYYNTKYWEHLYGDGGQYWKIKDGVSKAEALNDFTSPTGGKYKLDCAAAINLLILKAKLDVVGEQKFSKYLPDLMIRGWKTYTWKNGKLEEYETLERWSGSERMWGSPQNLKIGDYAYFKNDPMLEGTPEQGENTIFLGYDRYNRPLFFGLNIGIYPGTVHQYGILTAERGSIDPALLKKMAES